MTPESPSKNDAALRALLREWQVNPPLPPRFSDQIWRRIAGRETPGANLMTSVREWIGQALARPAFALSYATVLLLVGLTAGLWQAHLNSQHTAATLSARYLQMIDPYQTPRP